MSSPHARIARQCYGKKDDLFVAFADNPGDGGEQRLNLGARQVAGDKDEARAAVVRGPRFELDGAVRDMLHGMNDDRPLASLDRNDPLDPKEIGAAQL